MKVAVIGATGLVGRKMLQVLEQRNFPVRELYAVGSVRSVGKALDFDGASVKAISIEDALAARPDVALFSAGAAVSREWAPKFAEAGTYVIDNSSAWRMEADVPLVVPEVNPSSITEGSMIIANPNCSTIQMVVALAPLHRQYGLSRVVVSTYQSVTGTGKDAVMQYKAERDGKDAPSVYPHPIFENCIPHCDIFMDDGYTREEMKLVNETRKILGAPGLAITATAVRVPVLGGHSESVNIQLKNPADTNDLRTILRMSEGLTLVDDPASNSYPMPFHAHDKDDVFVGRLRRDDSAENAFNLWIVSDNLRKGAATNAVQIAESLVSAGILKRNVAM